MFNGAQGERGAGQRPHAAVAVLAIALAVVVLAACEHGNLSYNRSTGTFNLPFGPGSTGNPH